MPITIGGSNVGYEEVLGRHGLFVTCFVMNDNGERFADICAEHKLIIGGSVFPHRSVHKATWLSPNYTTEDQVEHMCTSRKFRRPLQDVRIKKSANTGSDHHLLVGKLKLKLKRAVNRVKYDIDLLKTPNIAKQVTITVRNRFQILQEMQIPRT